MKRAYFISDLHLGAAYIADKRAAEQRVVDFLHSIAADASHLFLLGDVLDYWFEYRKVVPRGYVRFFGALASLADRGVEITWYTGNHDVWLRDYLRDEIGLTVRTGKTVERLKGKTLFLSHGDDVGKQPAMYRFTRWCFYSKLCQFLYATIHPRWTTAIATGWSSANRTSRNDDEVRRAQQVCVERHREFCEDYNRKHPGEIDFFVFGHLHVARATKLSPGNEMVHLGDWIDKCTYATLDDDGHMELAKFGHDAPVAAL